MSLEALEHGVENGEMKEKARSNHTGTDNNEAMHSQCEEFVLKHRHGSVRILSKEALGKQGLITLKPWLAIVKS